MEPSMEYESDQKEEPKKRVLPTEAVPLGSTSTEETIDFNSVQMEIPLDYTLRRSSRNRTRHLSLPTIDNTSTPSSSVIQVSKIMTPDPQENTSKIESSVDLIKLNRFYAALVDDDKNSGYLNPFTFDDFVSTESTTFTDRVSIPVTTSTVTSSGSADLNPHYITSLSTATFEVINREETGFSTNLRFSSPTDRSSVQGFTRPRGSFRRMEEPYEMNSFINETYSVVSRHIYEPTPFNNFIPITTSSVIKSLTPSVIGTSSSLRHINYANHIVVLPPEEYSSPIHRIYRHHSSCFESLKLRCHQCINRDKQNNNDLPYMGDRIKGVKEEIMDYTKVVTRTSACSSCTFIPPRTKPATFVTSRFPDHYPESDGLMSENNELYEPQPSTSGGIKRPFEIYSDDKVPNKKATRKHVTESNRSSMPEAYDYFDEHFAKETTLGHNVPSYPGQRVYEEFEIDKDEDTDQSFSD